MTDVLYSSGLIDPLKRKIADASEADFDEIVRIASSRAEEYLSRSQEAEKKGMSATANMLRAVHDELVFLAKMIEDGKLKDLEG